MAGLSEMRTRSSPKKPVLFVSDGNELYLMFGGMVLVSCVEYGMVV